MKSIRLSLVVYFVLLEAAALGAASWLVYRTAEQSLQAEQKISRELLLSKFTEARERTRQAFDLELLNHARHVAGLTNQYFLTHRDRLDDFRLNDDLLPRGGEFTRDEMFQIDTEWGAAWRARTMGEHHFAINKNGFPSQSIEPEWRYNDIDMPNGRRGRRIQYLFRTTVVRRAGGPPWVLVQGAAATEIRDDAIDRFNGDLSQQLADQEQATVTSLAKLRTRLLLIGLLTFAASALGGSLLVGIGLAPLHRLTDAVSRVSSRDFQLPLGDVGMPAELGPIVARLRETLDELRRAFDREKQASADISHELRTPVAALLATLDVTLRKPRTAEEYLAALRSSRAIGGQMRQLVERLLALAKLDAGAARVKLAPIDIGLMIDECQALIGPLASEQNLDLRVSYPPHLVWSSDRDKLREMVVNLLTNAVQYNRPGGSITITAAESAGELEIAVSDTGIGIRPESLPHVFERFYRVDPSREASEINAGLGLSIVQGYALLLGGRVEATSRLNEGTTFRIRLPRRGASDQEREAA